MKREIFLKATAEKKQLPKQWGGMQTEDNATEIVFDITDIAKENILWRIDFDSATAGYDPSETLIAEGRNGGLCVARFIPYTMTRHGGEIQVTLVGTEIDEQGEAVAIAYTVPFFAFFTDVEQHEESEDKAAISISAAEKSALDAAQRAEDSADEAKTSAESAREDRVKTQEAQRILEEGSTIVFQGGDANSRVSVDLVVDDELNAHSNNPISNRAVARQFKEQDRMDAQFDEELNELFKKYALLVEQVENNKNETEQLKERLFIVENGKVKSNDGTLWDFIIWSNGDAECRCIMTQNFSIKGQWGNLYISSNQQNYATFPFEFVFEDKPGGEKPHCIYSVDSKNSSIMTVPQGALHADGKHSFAIQFARPNEVDNVEVDVYWTVKGKIKQEAN